MLLQCPNLLKQWKFLFDMYFAFINYIIMLDILKLPYPVGSSFFLCSYRKSKVRGTPKISYGCILAKLMTEYGYSPVERMIYNLVIFGVKNITSIGCPILRHIQVCKLVPSFQT